MSEVELFKSDNEALSSCEVTAKAYKKLGFAEIKVASAILICSGDRGTCSIPANEFGLQASCSGKRMRYDVYVGGVKVNK